MAKLTLCQGRPWAIIRRTTRPIAERIAPVRWESPQNGSLGRKLRRLAVVWKSVGNTSWIGRVGRAGRVEHGGPPLHYYVQTLAAFRGPAATLGLVPAGADAVFGGSLHSGKRNAFAALGAIHIVTANCGYGGLQFVAAAGARYGNLSWWHKLFPP